MGRITIAFTLRIGESWYHKGQLKLIYNTRVFLAWRIRWKIWGQPPPLKRKEIPKGREPRIGSSSSVYKLLISGPRLHHAGLVLSVSKPAKVYTNCLLKLKYQHFSENETKSSLHDIIFVMYKA